MPALPVPQRIGPDDSRRRGARLRLPAAGPRRPCALWEALANGADQVVSTDHCPFTKADRRRGVAGAGWSKFTEIPGGLPGVETRLSLIHQGVVDGRLTSRTLDRRLRRRSFTSLRPRGQEGRAGARVRRRRRRVRPVRARKTSNAAALHSRSDHSPYEGMTVTGWPALTFSRGRLVAKDGEPFDAEPGMGPVRSSPPGRLTGIGRYTRETLDGDPDSRGLMPDRDRPGLRSARCRGSRARDATTRTSRRNRGRSSRGACATKGRTEEKAVAERLHIGGGEVPDCRAGTAIDQEEPAAGPVLVERTRQSTAGEPRSCPKFPTTNVRPRGSERSTRPPARSAGRPHVRGSSRAPPSKPEHPEPTLADRCCRGRGWRGHRITAAPPDAHPRPSPRRR